MTIAASAGCGRQEQRRQENQCEKAKRCGNEVGQLGSRPGRHAYRCLGQAADDKETAEQAAKDVCRPVSDKLLVWIDAAAVLHRCGLRSAKRLGVANQHDGKRARQEL